MRIIGRITCRSNCQSRCIQKTRKHGQIFTAIRITVSHNNIKNVRTTVVSGIFQLLWDDKKKRPYNGCEINTDDGKHVKCNFHLMEENILSLSKTWFTMFSCFDTSPDPNESFCCHWDILSMCYYCSYFDTYPLHSNWRTSAIWLLRHQLSSRIAVIKVSEHCFLRQKKTFM